MVKPIRNRFEIPKLGMEIIDGSNVKLIFFRTDRGDLPHLTVSWRNTSREIDIHLKTRMPGEQEHHIAIAKFAESELARLVEAFQPDLLSGVVAALQQVRPVRPGWLGKRGYVVVFLDDVAEAQLLNRIAPVRRKKGKWTRALDAQALKHIAASREIIDRVFHPTVLHDLAAAGYAGPVFAQCTRGKRRGRLIVLCSRSKPGGMRSWVRIDGQLIDQIAGLSQKLLESCLRQLLPPDAQATVIAALRLDEIGSG